MNLMEMAKKWVVPLCICAFLLLLVSWRFTASDEGGHVVTMPVVTEESLTPEQRAQMDRLKQIQADALKNAGTGNQLPVDPREFANQLLEEDQARKAAESGGAAPENLPQ